MEPAAEIYLGPSIVLPVVPVYRYVNHVDQDACGGGAGRMVGSCAFFGGALETSALFRAAEDTFEVKPRLGDAVDIGDDLSFDGCVPAEEGFGCINSAQPREIQVINLVHLGEEIQAKPHPIQHRKGG